MTEVTRSEFDMLLAQVRADAIRVDATGTAALAVQVTEIIKDVTELRSDLREHRQEHVTAERARVASRRWAIGLALTGLATMGGLYGLLAAVLAGLH